MIDNSKEWFMVRIGKRVYRDASGCKCPSCKNAVESGIEIRDEIHAEYLADTAAEFANDGCILNYRDVK